MTRTGPAGGPIHVRVVAGGDQDFVDDSKSGGADLRTDRGEAKVERGDGTQVRRKVWANPAPVKDATWLEPRSYGHRTTGAAIFAYHPDIEFVLGYGFTRTAWGFRTQPAASVQSLRAGIATGEGTSIPMAALCGRVCIANILWNILRTLTCAHRGKFYG